MNDNGTLGDAQIDTSSPSLIGSLEALLIEALEPPLNRKRGDDFSSIEYIQEIDPELKEKEIKAKVKAFEQALRGSE